MGIPQLLKRVCRCSLATRFCKSFHSFSGDIFSAPSFLSSPTIQLAAASLFVCCCTIRPPLILLVATRSSSVPQFTAAAPFCSALSLHAPALFFSSALPLLLLFGLLLFVSRTSRKLVCFLPFFSLSARLLSLFAARCSFAWFCCCRVFLGCLVH